MDIKYIFNRCLNTANRIYCVIPPQDMSIGAVDDIVCVPGASSGSWRITIAVCARTFPECHIYISSQPQRPFLT